MMSPKKETTNRTLGQWNAYVLGGATLEERRERLAEVPEPIRNKVRLHVETWFAIKSYRYRKSQEKRKSGNDR